MERTKWINQLKGFAMICVVFGHCITGNVRTSIWILGRVYEYIYLFHMPLFFLLAGYLFQNNIRKYQLQGKKEFIQKKFMTLMIPYFTYSTFTYIILLIANNIPYIGNLLASNGYKMDSFFQSIIQILFWQDSLDQHMWFVYVLFIIFAINILCITIKNEKKNIITLIILLLFHCITLRCKVYLLQRSFQYIIYFVLGRIFNEKEIIEKIEQHKKSILIYMSALILSISKLLIIDLIFENYLFTVIKAIYSIVVSSVMIIALCLLAKKITNSWLAKKLEYVYQYNFEIYILHQPFIVSGTVLTLLKFEKIPTVLVVLLALILGIIVPIMLSKIIEKSKIARKVLFGRE